MKAKLWTKMSGAGNTFLLSHLKSRPKGRGKQDWRNRSIRLCRQYGTDGLVVLIPGKKKQIGSGFFIKRWFHSRNVWQCGLLCYGISV